MNCPQCQAPIQEDSAFCSKCGTRLVPAAASASPGGYPPPPGQGAPAGYGAPTGYEQGGPAAPTGQYPASGQQPPAGYPQGGGQYQPQRAPGSVTPYQFDLNRLTRADRIVGVASLITMITIWLPWFSLSVGGISGTASGTDAHGWLWLVFVLDLVILAYLAMRAGWEESPVQLPFAHEPLLIAATGLQLLLVLIAFFDMPGFTGVSVSWSWGAIIGLLAAIVAAAPVIAPRVRSYLDSHRASS